MDLLQRFNRTLKMLRPFKKPTNIGKGVLMRFSVANLMALALSLVSVVADAQGTPDTPPPADPPSTTQSSRFDPQSWGLGVGVAVEFYEKPYIKEATLVGETRRVVVTDSTKSEPSFWAVGNWTATNCQALIPPFRMQLFCGDYHKPGFFVGLKLIGETGTGLEGVSLGLQWAFLQSTKNERGQTVPASDQRPSWNLGVGYVNHRTRHLANGVHADQPLPADFTDIAYRKRSESSWILMISKNIR